MDPVTGKIKEFKNSECLNDAIKKGWVDWNVDEVVTVKKCAFRVKEINIEEQTIILKAISKRMTKK